jgi:hypothetical protein
MDAQYESRYVTSTEGINEAFYDGHSPRDQLFNLRKEDKLKFTGKVILDFLELKKGTGASVSDIVEVTGFDRDTVTKHLMYLVATRQAYSTSGTAKIYHKNGRVLHYKNMQNRVFDKRFYTFFQLQQNFEDDYVYIQEKEVGKLKSVSVKGGIMISMGDFKRFIDELSEFYKEMVENKK